MSEATRAMGFAIFATFSCEFQVARWMMRFLHKKQGRVRSLAVAPTASEQRTEVISGLSCQHGTGPDRRTGWGMVSVSALLPETAGEIDVIGSSTMVEPLAK